jgi:hypothetical protein
MGTKASLESKSKQLKPKYNWKYYCSTDCLVKHLGSISQNSFYNYVENSSESDRNNSTLSQEENSCGEED